MLDHLRGWLLWLVNKTTAVFPWPPWPSGWLVQLPSTALSPLPHEISEPKRQKHFCSCASAEKRRSLLLCYQRVKDPLWYDSKVICVRVIFVARRYRLLQTIGTSVKLAYIRFNWEHFSHIISSSINNQIASRLRLICETGPLGH